MRTPVIVLATLMSVALPLTAASAQQTEPRPEPSHVEGHDGGPVQARWILDAPVRDAEGQALGNVLRVWIDPSDGRVQSLVVSSGGVDGRPITRRVVHWDDVQIGWTERRLHLVLDRDTLDRAPEATEAEMEEMPAASPAGRTEGTIQRD